MLVMRAALEAASNASMNAEGCPLRSGTIEASPVEIRAKAREKTIPIKGLVKPLESLAFFCEAAHIVRGGKRRINLGPCHRYGSQTDGRPLGWWPTSP